MGPRVVAFGAEDDPDAFLKPLRDSMALVRDGDWDSVRALAEDGYSSTSFCAAGCPLPT
jgi:hypothetical protein